MELGIVLLRAPFAITLLGIEVILARAACKNLAGLGDLEAFGIGFIGLHGHKNRAV